MWGGESREEGGFDCSGLVDYAFTAAGHALPGRPTAAVLWHMGIPVKRKDLRPGDLAFLGSKSGQPYHVALYAGGGMVIVASGRGQPIAAEPLDSVDWDGFARIWAPSGQPPIVNPRHSRDPDPEARADRIAAARVLRDLGAPATDSAAVQVVVPPAPHRRPAPARRPRRPARTETPMIVADPRVRPATVRSAFPLPSA